FFQAEDGIRASSVTGVQTCALPIYLRGFKMGSRRGPHHLWALLAMVAMVYCLANADYASAQGDEAETPEGDDGDLAARQGGDAAPAPEGSPAEEPPQKGFIGKIVGTAHDL